ncbi:MAG: hypothetical protein ACI8UO_000453 [Verrucomicrobiales bacterium]|jgi:hypothetical protein
MNLDRWEEHFRRNAENRPEPDWNADCDLPENVACRLVRSLEQFELGDGGGPASLIAWNAESFRCESEQTRKLVDLWFEEEKEHSRLLNCAVKRFGGQPIETHWSFRVFCAVRRWLGVRFELTALLLTELVSTVYYRLIWRHGQDSALREMCRLIIRDETGHVAFHRARMAELRKTGRRRFGWCWAGVFRILGLAAGTMLWVNHRSALRALGATDREFYREVRGELTRFIKQLRRESSPESIRIRRPLFHQTLCDTK